MKAIKEFKKSATDSSEELLSKIPSTLSNISEILNTLFPYTSLSTADSSFATELTNSGLDGENTTISKIIPATQDLLYAIISDIQTLERYISIHVPPMEDGNNFGVSVQMTISKVLKDMREDFTKRMDGFSKYYASRAEAVEKLNLAKVSTTETKTKTDSDSSGGKDGDEKKVTTTVVVKEECSTSGLKRENYFRLKHLVSLDVQFYSEMRSVCVMVLDAYAVILDNMEKNKEKLLAPKGTSGGNNFSMY